MSLQGGIFGQRAGTPQGGALRELALFTVGDVLCGVDLMGVQEVLAAPPPAGEAGSGVMPLPDAPLFVKGVINLRGQALPLVDLRKRFGLAALPLEGGSPKRAKGASGDATPLPPGGPRRGVRRDRVLVIRIAGQLRGFLVDAVAGILRVPAGSVEPPPALGKQRSSYLQGVTRQGDRLVLLLDLEQVLTKEEQLRLDEVLRRSQESRGEESGGGGRSKVKSQESNVQSPRSGRRRRKAES